MHNYLKVALICLYTFFVFTATTSIYRLVIYFILYLHLDFICFYYHYMYFYPFPNVIIVRVHEHGPVCVS